MSQKNLVMLVIMDGYGIRNVVDGHAIANAKKPNLDYLFINLSPPNFISTIISTILL